MEKNEALRT